MKYFVGLDLSLTGTGLVILNEKGKMIKHELIKSKKTGDKPSLELDRIMEIRAKIFNSIDSVVKDEDYCYVAIEGVAYGVNKTTSLIQLAALNYMVREWLSYNEWEFVIVAPTSLKKYITGKGNIHKEMMLMETQKKYKISFEDNNTCDAFGLAIMVYSLMNPNYQLTKFQQEAINLIKKQQK